MPQHCDEEPHAAPWPEQPVPPVHTPPVQDSELQHWLELVQEAPAPLQPVEPVHTPPEQVKVPQHWLELEQEVPAPWQPPPEQTLLALQVSTPQQSPLELQRWLTSWQGPVRSGSVGSVGPSSPPQARAKATGKVKKARRRKVLRGGTMQVVYPRRRIFSRARGRLDRAGQWRHT